MNKKNLVVLSGAGISAESGIKTFRDADGLWEGHNVQEVATPEAWRKNKALVLDFYNQRRRQLKTVEPNAAHRRLAGLQDIFEVQIITQNVDDLHERAGSKSVVHLHGELLKARSEINEQLIVDWHKDILVGDTSPDGAQLRPHIVWFGEAVPMISVAAQLISKADAVLIIGTSMQVYPAAGLIDYASKNALKIYVDPKPALISGVEVEVIAATATEGIFTAERVLTEALL